MGVPRWKIDEIQNSFPKNCLQEWINFFVEFCPKASWRAVIVALEKIKETAKENDITDQIRYLAERITGSKRNIIQPPKQSRILIG